MQMEPATYQSYTDYSPRSIITQRSPARSSTAVECTSLSPRQCTNAWRQALRRPCRSTAPPPLTCNASRVQ